MTKANGMRAAGCSWSRTTCWSPSSPPGCSASWASSPTVTHSAKEALERLAGGDRPTLIFTDIVMPGGISGIELAHKVRGRFPELPILLTTGYSEEVTGSHGFPVLQKPYELESLAAALSKLLKLDIAAD